MRKIWILYLACFLPGLLCAEVISKNHLKDDHSIDEHSYEESVFKSGKIITLGDAILKAVEASPRLQKAQYNLNAREGSINQATVWPNPELEITAENFGGNGEYKGTKSAEYTLGLNQKIEIGGKRLYRVNASKAAKDAAYRELLNEKLILERDVHIAYANVLAEAEAFRLSIEQEKLAKEILEVVSNRVKAAIEPQIQQSKAEIAFATATMIKGNQERALKVAKKKLASFWSDDDLEFSLEHAHFFKLKAPNSFEHYQKKLSDSSELKKFDHMVDEYQARLNLEKAKNIPDPNINVGVRQFRETRNKAFVLGISIALPIFDQNSGNITSAVNELEKIKSEKNNMVIDLNQQLFENWQDWKKAYIKATELNKTIIPAAENAFKLAIAGYEKGKFPYLEVLDSQRTLFDARAQSHQMLKWYHASRSEVERLIALSDVNN